MPLADDIRSLQARILADFDEAHDYHTDTVFAWRILLEYIAGGRIFSNTNVATGSITTQKELLTKSAMYVSRELAEATFQQFISIFEHFFFELLRLWMTNYPRSLGGRKIDFKDVLEAPDKEAITTQVVSKELNELMYDRPVAWFAYLEERSKIGCPSEEEIARISEAKAARDILAHNRGIANKTYESKAGRFARFKEGERLEITEPYHSETWELLRKVVADISSAAAAKAS